ncbi:MAG: DNA primase [Elusimicrobia bacterium]|nr:DNA primase [Elusimicrobiota bacterium]
MLDLVREYARDLKKSGKSWVANCPFHEEKTPSMHIDPDKGLFHCFGCKKGGDAIHFYREMENVGFKEAVEDLCERYGLARPSWTGSSRQVSPEEKYRAAVKKALDLAAKLYGEAFLLREDREAEAARKYCLSVRHFKHDALAKYGVGYAPQGPNWLFTQLVTKHGLDPRILQKAGLVTVSPRDGRYRDLFRQRLMFPVADVRGDVCGFGGRILEDSGSWAAKGSIAPGPKYLNSPDTDFFKKGEILYGLADHKALIREKGKAYVVEGYFDVLGLAQAGLPLAVSPMGGALTAAQAKVLRRFAGETVLLFDPDTAGFEGAIRAGRLCLVQGFVTRLLKLPSGLDPDEFVLKYGAQTFEELEKREAKSLIEFELEFRLAGRGVAALRLEERQQTARALLPSLAAMASEMDRSDAVIFAAQALRISPVGLERELEHFLGQDGGLRSQTKRGPSSAEPKDAGFMLSLEEAILALAIQDREPISRVLSGRGVTASDFEDGRIGRYIFSSDTQERAEDPSWTEVLARVVLSAENPLSNEEFDRMAEGYAAELRRKILTRERAGLDEAIKLRRKSGRACEAQLLARFLEVSKLLKNNESVFEEA